MKKAILILISIIFFSQVNAQSDDGCLPEGIGFYTQNEVDLFEFTHPGCTVIEGNVGIMGSDITNLNGLSVLTEIEGELQVSATNIENFEGLNNLESIGGSFNVWQAESLTNFYGLESLTNIDGDFDVQRNNALTSFEGLNSIMMINNLYVKDNPMLFDMEGVESLTDAQSVAFLDNDALTSLNGLQNLTQINGSLALTNCTSLTSVEGLNNLSNIDMHLTISGCNALTDLTAFSALTEMNGQLFIAYNDILESLAGLDNINYENLSGLSIGSNPMLSQCAVNSVCGYVNNNSPSGSDNIGGNATGCNSWEEVQEACVGISVDRFMEKEMMIYPNPAHDILMIDILNSDSYTLEIYDISGVRVIESEVRGARVEVDIRGLRSGVYEVVMRGEERTYTDRMIVY